MQLIFETHSTEDINVKMSTQAESAINGVITSDLNKENSIANKENYLKTEDKNEPSDIIKEAVLKEGKYQEVITVTNGNDTCAAEDVIQENDVLDKISNKIYENSSSRIEKSQIENKSESELVNIDNEKKYVKEVAESNDGLEKELVSTTLEETDIKTISKSHDDIHETEFEAEKDGVEIVNSKNTEELSKQAAETISTYKDKDHDPTSTNRTSAAVCNLSNKSNPIDDELDILTEDTEDALDMGGSFSDEPALLYESSPPSDVDQEMDFKVKKPETQIGLLDEISTDESYPSTEFKLTYEASPVMNDISLDESSLSKSDEGAIKVSDNNLISEISSKENVSSVDAKQLENMDEDKNKPLESADIIELESKTETTSEVKSDVTVSNNEAVTFVDDVVVETEKCIVDRDVAMDEAERDGVCSSNTMKENDIHAVTEISKPALDEAMQIVNEPLIKSHDISDLVDSTVEEIEMLDTEKHIADEGSKESINSIKENSSKAVEENTIHSEKNVVDDFEKPNVPMEVDDVEIFHLDKENQDESNNKPLTSEIVNKDLKTMLNGIDSAASEIVPTEDAKLKDVSISNDDNNTSKAIIENEEKLIQDDQDKVEIIEDDIKVVENKKEDEVEIIKDDIKVVENKKDEPIKAIESNKPTEVNFSKELPVVCKLSNNLDILSDDEDEPQKTAPSEPVVTPPEKLCINIDDDDDIMLIEEDSIPEQAAAEDQTEVPKDAETVKEEKVDIDTSEIDTTTDISELSPKINEKDLPPESNVIEELRPEPKTVTTPEIEPEQKKPLLPINFLKTAKKNLADMTRDELEDFCILRIVESIVDRSNLSEIKSKIKTMSQSLEDYRKRAINLTKQNRDLQIVLKSVQEEQKKRAHSMIQPLKITRSVGMQVLMNDKIDGRRKGPITCSTAAVPTRVTRSVQNNKQPVKPTPPANIPVPRKVPVNNSPAKAVTNTIKTTSPNPNGLRNPSPVQRVPEKRTHSRMQASSSVTVDLTDDEPPPKVNNKNSPAPPVRVVPSQNLMPQQRAFSQQSLNSPRKVYIPISGPQGNIRPGQTVLMRNATPSVPRQRVPALPRMQQSPARPTKQMAQRHPAPLPESMKQYTPPTWKALPPAPDLKLSKVENGIVISWKIDGYPEGGYETIASYQLYAYQETTAPPCTALWKKIGDVKALPLPMACTLTQFMAGFKYYFAVRAVDVRSRLGPFSLPGSILLLNKV